LAMNKMKQMQVTRVSSTPQTTRKAVPKCSNTELVSQKLTIKLRLCIKIFEEGHGANKPAVTPVEE